MLVGLQWIIKMSAIQKINIQNVIIWQRYISFWINTSLPTKRYISHLSGWFIPTGFRMSIQLWVCWSSQNNYLWMLMHVYRGQIVASELKDPICHSDECQIGSFSSEATRCCYGLWCAILSKPSDVKNLLMGWRGTTTPVCSHCVITEFDICELNILIRSYNTHKTRIYLTCSN